MGEGPVEGDGHELTAEQQKRPEDDGADDRGQQQVAAGDAENRAEEKTGEITGVRLAGGDEGDPERKGAGKKDPDRGVVRQPAALPNRPDPK